MNLTKKMTVALGLAVAGASFAQTAASSSTTTGLLGQRYASLSAGAIDPHGSSDEGLTTDLSVNLPLQAGIDLGIGYSYSRLNQEARLLQIRSRDHTLYSTTTFYTQVKTVKPFAAVALGYQWSQQKVNFIPTSGPVTIIDDHDGEAVWGLATGVEIPLGLVTVTPAVSYQDGFKRTSASGFVYGTEASMWFTPKVGGFADVNFTDPTGGGTQAWTYRAGVRLKF